MTYDELQGAIRLFGFEDRITLRQIKERYRLLARQYHPDHGAGDLRQMEEINRAYALLMQYGEQYRLSFSEEEFYAQNDEQCFLRQFAEDPVWGN